jgi:tRNA (mo5U34)-methyltransferase
MSEAAARSFVEAASIQWYQRFELAPGVYTPGTRDVSWVYEHARVPTDLSGLSVLDVGTTNGGVAFEAERRGAARVVAVDICSPDVYGFSDLRTFFGSRVEYREATVYDLARTFEDRFDVVFFLGVLYHLRHPLLALDNLRELTGGVCYLETAIADEELGEQSSLPVVRFYRRDELGGDAANWFAPTIVALLDMCRSSGFEAELIESWPDEGPSRCIVELKVSPDTPEFVSLSYERPFGRLPHWSHNAHR